MLVPVCDEDEDEDEDEEEEEGDDDDGDDDDDWSDLISPGARNQLKKSPQESQSILPLTNLHHSQIKSNQNITHTPSGFGVWLPTAGLFKPIFGLSKQYQSTPLGVVAFAVVAF